MLERKGERVGGWELETVEVRGVGWGLERVGTLEKKVGWGLEGGRNLGLLCICVFEEIL